MIKDKSILITGGSSMVGKHMKEILPAGYNVIYIDSSYCDLTDIYLLNHSSCCQC